MTLFLRCERSLVRSPSLASSLSTSSRTLFQSPKAPKLPNPAHLPQLNLHRQELAKMKSYLNSINPTPSFPEYTGPYKVGTIDVEIPVSELESPSTLAPETTKGLPTVLFRIWYPCRDEPEKKHEKITWLPQPQREHISAYSRFLGAGKTAASIISFFPRVMHYICPPARKNAPLLQAPTGTGKWPLMIFSHGLGGNRNTYSHIVGSIASHGVVVITPEHRDGSAPISYSRNPGSLKKHDSITTDYQRAPHAATQEVHDIRTSQLKIRIWELGLIYDALIRTELGKTPTNMNASSSTLLPMFNAKLALHNPGEVSFAGHSFGAATVSQFVKSVFYSPYDGAPTDFDPLYLPKQDSAIKAQITPNTPLVLLDIWLLPLRSPSSRWLWNKPLPCYAPGGPGGQGVLAIESQAFWKWRVHLKVTKRFLSPDPGCIGSARICVIDDRPPPHFYYATASAHLSQSDFGILFPWATKRFMGCEEPERVLRLNTRAVLQLMRDRGIPVAPTSAKDMELAVDGKATDSASGSALQDNDIFSTTGTIRSWNFLDLDVSGMTDVKAEDEETPEDRGQGQSAMGGGEEADGMAQDPSEAVMQGEMMRRDDSTNEGGSGSGGSRV